MNRITFGAAAVAVAGSLAAFLSPAIAQEGLTLTFNSFGASPAVLTGFAIEQPLAPVPPELISGAADTQFPRIEGGNVLTAPKDAKRDGKWLISAQWVELGTDKAWKASVEIPIKAMTSDDIGYTLLVVFGPNGEMLIGSDRFSADPSARVDIADICGTRVPESDKAWRRETGYFPGLTSALSFMKSHQAAGAKPLCAPR